MPINAFPIATVPPTASLITNVPAGVVTANDVQTAINQLAIMIPSPGPGTDPLFLTQGLNLEGYNTTSLFPGADTFTLAAQIAVGADASAVQPVFSNIGGLAISIYGVHGQATYGASTQAKISFMPLQVSGTYNASGQKFLYANTLTAYGMSDSSVWANNLVQFAGGPVNGDEGQGWGLVSNLQQQAFLQMTTISLVPTAAVINTTTTQVINASKDAQTVTVVNSGSLVSSPNSNQNWVVVEQAIESNSLNTEAVQITAFTATSITGKFRCNHANGVTVTPALVLWCPSTFQMGQDRFLINYTQPSYFTGQVSAISGGGMDFSGGPALSPTIVGGNVKNIGCIALACDDYTSSPFDAGANRLKDWYQITQVTSATHLAVNSYSIAGDASYKGKGTIPTNLPTNYIIRPSARVLRVMDSGDANVTGQIICETSTSTWNLNDVVGQATCPYPDVTGLQYSMGCWSAGGSYRSFMIIKNTGARTFESCFFIDDWGTIHQATADDISWGTMFAVNTKHRVGISMRGSVNGVLAFTTPLVDGAATTPWTRMYWDTSTGARIECETTNSFGLTIQGTQLSGVGNLRGIFQFSSPGSAASPGTNALLSWYGHLYMPNPSMNGSTPGTFTIDKVTDPINYERAFLRWDLGAHDTLEVGTEKGGTGTARAMVLKTDNVEQIRLAPGVPVKFSSAPNFSANATVATALGSLGPVGSHTAVQKWLTIVDNTGATLYIPCF